MLRISDGKYLIVMHTITSKDAKNRSIVATLTRPLGANDWDYPGISAIKNTYQIYSLFLTESTLVSLSIQLHQKMPKLEVLWPTFPL